MSFVTFYRLNAHLSAPSRSLETKVLTKFPRHELQSYGDLVAKTVGYIHSYTIMNSRTDSLIPTSLFDQPDGPHFSDAELKNRQFSTEPSVVVYVGDSGSAKVYQCYNNYKNAQHILYFYTKDQIDKFCRSIKGFNVSWMRNFEAYQIDSDGFEELILNEARAFNWEITLLDDTDLYLSAPEGMFSLTFTKIDLESYFQSCVSKKTA